MYESRKNGGDERADSSMTWLEKTAEPLVQLNKQNVRSEGGPLSSSNSAQVPGVEEILAYNKLDQVATDDKLGNQDTELVSSEESLFKLRCKVENIEGEERASLEKATGKDMGVDHLEEDEQLVKEAMRMSLENHHSFSSFIEQLNDQLASREQNLHFLEEQWDIERKCLEEKKWNVMESICVDRLDCQRQLHKLKEIDQEMHSVLSEFRLREVECAKLAGDLEKQPKGASRRSYIQRITEITKNSRKLDMDIERILKETRELKLESNSIEERLHRTYAVVDETIFREAKKDVVGRQVYRLLTNIHESFEKIRDEILGADKVKREVAELEVKLLAMASRSSDKDTLQANLDAIRRENQHLRGNPPVL